VGGRIRYEADDCLSQSLKKFLSVAGGDGVTLWTGDA